MHAEDTVIATFLTHEEAESGIKRLATSGFDMASLSIVGKGYHTEETVVGFYNIADRVTFWGKKGAFWGALWGLFFGGAFLTLPAVGSVVVLGYLAVAVASAVESAVLIGGVSALSAALYSIGIPKDSIIDYEAVIKADGFLVMAHGSAADIARAKAILATAGPSKLDTHSPNVDFPGTGTPIPVTA